jgi:hypothetical protein
MLNKLAIVIVGIRNAGKTTTLRHFCNAYHNKTVHKRFRRSWKYGLMPFRDKTDAIKIDGYFLTSSPSEVRIPLQTTINKGFRPDFLFMAEQYNSDYYADSIRCLWNNGYHVKEFFIDHNIPTEKSRIKLDDNCIYNTVWRKYDKVDELLFHSQRTEQIAEYVRLFINTQI